MASANTNNALDGRAQQRVAALTVARDLIGTKKVTGLFASSSEPPANPDTITDLIEVAEYILTGDEVTHLQDRETGAVAVYRTNLRHDMHRIEKALTPTVEAGPVLHDPHGRFVSLVQFAPTGGCGR